MSLYSTRSLHSRRLLCLLLATCLPVRVRDISTCIVIHKHNRHTYTYMVAQISTPRLHDLLPRFPLGNTVQTKFVSKT